MFQKKNTNDDKTFNKKKESKMPKSKEKSSIGLGTIIIPLVLAAAIVVLIFVAVKAGSNSGDKVKCFVAKGDIPANTYVTDYEDYFESTMLDSSAVPSSAITGNFPDSFYIASKMNKSQMVLEDDIIKSNSKVEGINKTTELTGISVKDFNFAVGGTLRSGDLIDIYAMNPETDTLDLMVEDILIKDALDSTGNKIVDEGVATAFNIFAPQEKEEAINKALSFGDIQLYMAK